MKYLETARRQRGVALLVALLILVIVSLMGITAMKTSMFSSKISTGTQVDAMSFEGAESAVEDAFGYLYGINGAEMLSFMNGQIMHRCLTANGVNLTTCQSSDRMDSRGLVKAESRIRQKGMRPVDGGQVSMTGTSSITVDYTFDIIGDSEIEQFEVDDHHLQQALKSARVSSSDFNNIGQE
ncbi:PilX N-terminal domain-containing pilus assembly protein [Alloalcanivorax marinus]|uniref:PilX N-terminal domain-containing pilus assembly protein n=1 Tax=Alloalcanivorax marinus TaxID=1177169 RepID=UPI0021D38B71|nr:PilX N-terminal domain-containing pilus assembly protein [Alloalcanivorax marinus]MCU5785440.1 hypothetical protein [Alloalcanivorax marinus]